MPKYSWKAQYSENYIDKFQINGEIEKDNAIDQFQLFPWDKEINDYKRSTDNPTIPKIIFISDDQRQLQIEAVSSKGFTLEYFNFISNKCSEFYISNDFEKKNYTVEELIDFFFDSEIETHLKLTDILKEIIIEAKERKTPKNVEFVFNPKHYKTLGLSTFLLLGTSICLLLIDKIKGLDLPYILHIALIITWIPSFILHFTYYIKNYSAKVIIDSRNHELTYIKGSYKVSFDRDDIFRCQVTKTNSNKSSWDNYSYVWFILNDRTYISITCFITDPYDIVDALNCKYEEKPRSFPFLPI